MLNRSASLAMSACVLKALPGKLDIKRHSPSILYHASSEGSGEYAHMHRLARVVIALQCNKFQNDIIYAGSYVSFTDRNLNTDKLRKTTRFVVKQNCPPPLRP